MSDKPDEFDNDLEVARILAMTDEEVINCLINDGYDPEIEAQKAKDLIEQVIYDRQIEAEKDKRLFELPEPLHSKDKPNEQ